MKFHILELGKPWSMLPLVMGGENTGHLPQPPRAMLGVTAYWWGYSLATEDLGCVLGEGWRRWAHSLPYNVMQRSSIAK